MKTAETRVTATQMTARYSVSGELTPQAPFDFGKSLDFIGMFPPAQGEQTVGERSLTKAVMLDGQAVAFVVRSVGTVEAPRLAYTLWSDAPLTADVQARARDRITFYLSLDDDLRPFYALAAADAPFAAVVQRLYGLHQVKFVTPFENACWAVLTQRTPMALARRLKDALTERYGGSVTVDGAAYWAFPEAARLAAVDPAELAALLRNERKASSLSAVIAFFAATDEAWLRTGDYDTVRAALRGVRGIGEWSAGFILIRGLGRTERMLNGGDELAHAAARVYGPEAVRSPEELRAHAERYGAAQGYWAYYLRSAGDA